MGWDDVGSKADEPMTSAQRNMIIMLREKFDGVAMGSYADDYLPQWTKSQARYQIERLKSRLAEKGIKG